MKKLTLTQSLNIRTHTTTEFTELKSLNPPAPACQGHTAADIECESAVSDIVAVTDSRSAIWDSVVLGPGNQADHPQGLPDSGFLVLLSIGALLSAFSLLHSRDLEVGAGGRGRSP